MNRFDLLELVDLFIELVSTALPEFLSGSSENSVLKKFIVQIIDLDRAEGARLVA